MLVHLGPTSDTATAWRIEGMRFHEEYYTSRVQCEVITAADYMHMHAIDEADFVKIDVEGMDLEVIRGFGAAPGRARDPVRIRHLQYRIARPAQRFLSVSAPAGLRHRQDLSAESRLLDYHFSMENFHGSNYVAVREDQTAFIESLAGQARSGRATGGRAAAGH